MSVFRAVSALARRQHGTITRTQMLEAGIGDRAIRRLAADGVLERMAPGVYAVGGSPDTWHRRLAAELHRGGPLAVVSHRAAAGLFRLDRFRPGHLDLLAPTPAARTGTGVQLHRSCDLPARDRTVMDGLAVTTPTRTLVDMGATSARLVWGR